MKSLFATADDYTLAFVRLVLGIIFFIHGGQLALGWFGGYGFHATMHVFTTVLGIPALFACLAILTQLFGGIGLIVGLLSRLAALGIGIIMLVVIFTIHLHYGFFMNWSGTQKGEGFEYHLLAIAICVLITVKGAGALSIDRLLAKA